MLTCDKCQKPIEDRRRVRQIPLHYAYACRGWQSKEFDICDDCRMKLANVIAQAECDYINRKEKEA